MAGSSNGQDEVNPEWVGSILPAPDCSLCSRKSDFFGVIFWPYNKSFIDQACSVKMAGYWPRSFMRFHGLRFHLCP